MKTETLTRKRVEYHVQYRDSKGWIVVAEFDEDEYPEARRTWEKLSAEPSACIVEVATYTTVDETQVWPFEWTEERGRCHHHGLADHDAHVISERRGQFCRGNGPFMAEEGWVPGDRS